MAPPQLSLPGLVGAIADAARRYDGESGSLRINLGPTGDPGFEALALLPGAKKRGTVYSAEYNTWSPDSEPYVIEVVEVRLGAADLHAQRSRPATAEEAALLDGPEARGAGIRRTATVPVHGEEG